MNEQKEKNEAARTSIGEPPANRGVEGGGMKLRLKSIPRHVQRGLGVVGKLLVIPAALVVLLILAVGFHEGRKAYWDYQVREMCEKDGGVKIFEKLRVLRADIELLGRVDGKLGVPVKELAHPQSPAYSLLTRSDLREWNPRVSRSESTIVRRADQVILARSVVYARSGGDFPTGLSEGTSFVCPEIEKITSDLQQLFAVEEGSK